MHAWLFELLSDWLTWVSLGIGLGVTGTILWLTGLLGFRKRSAVVAEDDIPWPDLLEFLKNQQMPGGGGAPQAWEKLPPEELLKQLLQQLPQARSAARTAAALEQEGDYLVSGHQRRASRRRWLNPTEVRLSTGLIENSQKGLVINQSAGGLAILTDHEHHVGGLLFVAPVETPKEVRAVAITVRHVRQAGSLWIIGCQYQEELPWNIKVWFG